MYNVKHSYSDLDMCLNLFNVLLDNPDESKATVCEIQRSCAMITKPFFLIPLSFQPDGIHF